MARVYCHRMVDLGWLAAKFPELSNLASLGAGGQKFVFSASHPTDGQVVLKLIYPNQDPERVRRELLAVQRVNCSRVPRVLDAGVIQLPAAPVTVSCTWVREQRIMGTVLRASVQAGGIPLRGVKELGLHLLEALAAAEAVRIVHRDVKPENVMCDSAWSSASPVPIPILPARVTRAKSFAASRASLSRSHPWSTTRTANCEGSCQR